MSTDKTPSTQTESFEAKLIHAKAQLEKLMAQDITLEESVRLYEEGLKSIQEAQRLIEEAKAKIEVIEQQHAGTQE
jgi:exodeoxyribonuclease VII small subunit